MGASQMEGAREVIAEQIVVGDPSGFAIGCAFLGDNRCTEISMWANGINLLGFTKEDCHYTTRWLYLEGLVAWLNSFARNITEDPFPIEAEGEFAAEKDAYARAQLPEVDDDSTDEEMDELDAQYDLFGNWSFEHTWISERGGAILPDIFFEYKNGMIELSWDNRNAGDGVVFDCEFGGTRVDAETFKKVVLDFVEAYEQHWGIKVDDDSTWLRKG
ncbi:hypothetical protein [Olsenella phocaeensis]|uniref:hypothetical protein n=1 Tax=Olsenella phocaeensis TaxID=1852385 RepID=UPI003A951596